MDSFIHMFKFNIIGDCFKLLTANMYEYLTALLWLDDEKSDWAF